MTLLFRLTDTWTYCPAYVWLHWKQSSIMAYIIHFRTRNSDAWLSEYGSSRKVVPARLHNHVSLEQEHFLFRRECTMIFDQLCNALRLLSPKNYCVFVLNIHEQSRFFPASILAASSWNIENFHFVPAKPSISFIAFDDTLVSCLSCRLFIINDLRSA